MSWSIRDPPSPIFVPSLDPESICQTWPNTPTANTPNLSPTPRAEPPIPSSPRPSSAPNISLDLVGREQWSMNPLQIKSTFAIVGENDYRPPSSPVCGMGWSFNLDLCREPVSVRKKKGLKPKTARYIVSDQSVVVVHASLQSGPAGFPPGNHSIHASFRRDDCILAVLENDREDCVPQNQSTIPLGRCDLALPLGEILIDLVITLSFSGSEPFSEVPRTISLPMFKAIRATLDGSFPVDVKFMLFTRKHGTSVCNRRPIYASSSILKGRSAFLESCISGSLVGDGPHSQGVYQYPYDEDSDLESDLGEDPPCDIPGVMSDITTREPRPESLSPALSPVNITNLDTVQPGPPKFPRSEKSSAGSILDVDAGSPLCKKLPIKSLHSCAEIDSLSCRKSNGSCVSEHEKTESPICDESMGRSAEVMNHRADDYLTDRADPQEKAPASFTRLALVNDVAFRTFRALIVYMYSKEVAFIPLKSSGGRSYNVGDACSPKSMYRLAVKASHEGLKKHAFDNLRSQLGPANIITEIFSKFTTDHPEIFEMELKVLLDHFVHPTVRGEWERMIDIVADGQLPHGADVLKQVTRVLRPRLPIP